MLFELRPRFHRLYASLPILGPMLEDFTDWSRQCGYALGTICNQLMHARHIVRFLQQKLVHATSDLSPELFEQAWEHFRHHRPGIAGTVRQLERFMAENHMLVVPLPAQETRAHTELAEFGSYLKKVRGLEDSTIRSHLIYLRRFLDAISFDTDRRALSSLATKQIDGFLSDCAKTANRYTLQHVVGYLRAFLRFEYSKGGIQRPLHRMIDTPRVYRLEKLPRSVHWETVNRLLASIDRTEPLGVRNYAMLLLIATYGLRSCEVVSLTFDHIDWRGGQIQVPPSKGGNLLVLPLTDSVANALIAYLKIARPKLPCREIFLRARAPHGKLKPTAVTEVFQRQVRLSGLDIPYQGAHCLRHSYAVHLLRQGTSLKAIGDLLGHRNTESTCVYLRLETDELRSVALEVPPCPDFSSPLDSSALQDLPQVKSSRTYKSLTPSRGPLADDIAAYLAHHRALGKIYRTEQGTLLSLDTFLAVHCPEANDLTGSIFNRWCETFADLTPTGRRSRMRIVRNFCLYRLRSDPHCFVPDRLTFPAEGSDFAPYILSASEMGRILGLARKLPASPSTPLRPQVIRLALVLLYTCGLRRGELLHLTLGDYDRKESTLFVRSTKFHKERVVPLSLSADAELQVYLKLRQQRRLPMDESSPIILSRVERTKVRAYAGTGLARNWRTLCASLKILTPQHIPPRIHDIRHAFAVNALLRWYQNGENVQAKLPQLSSYMGHVSVASTQCYLAFVEPLRSAASLRFEHHYSGVIPNQMEEMEADDSPHQ